MPDVVTMIVNPGRKARDKVNQRDVGPGEEFTCSEKEAKLAVATGVASRAPVRNAKTAEAKFVPPQTHPAPGPDVTQSLDESAPYYRRTYRRRDLKAEE